MVRPFLLFGSGLCCCRTVTELVGADMVKGIDGISYLPLLTGNGEVSRSHEYIYYEFYEQGGKQSILKDGWKLVRLNMSKPEKLKEELYYLPDESEKQRKADKSGRGGCQDARFYRIMTKVFCFSCRFGHFEVPCTPISKNIFLTGE